MVDRVSSSLQEEPKQTILTQNLQAIYL